MGYAVRIGLAVLATALLASAGCKRDHPPPPEADPLASGTTGPDLNVGEVSFAGPGGHRPSAIFAPGEVVTCLLSVSNYTHREGQADLNAHIRVTGPDGQRVLIEHGLPLLHGEAPTTRPGQLRTAAQLRLSPAALPGRHKVQISVDDRLSGRTGDVQAHFTIAGKTPRRARHLVVAPIRSAGDRKMPPGSVIPIAFEARGFATREEEGQFALDLGVDVRVLDRTGKEIARQQETLVKQRLPFRPLHYPLEYAVGLPDGLQPGAHEVLLTVQDRIAKRRSRARLPFEIIPRTFGVYNIHLHDASGLPRSTYRFGEQAFLRFSVQGFGTVEGQARLAVDLVIAGPDGGVYLAQRDAATLDESAGRTAARTGRFAAQLPLVLPNLAPPGDYRLVVRARDLAVDGKISREVPFRLEGKAPPPLSTLRIDELGVRMRADLPVVEADTFVAGQRYKLEVRVGGVKLDEVKRLTYRADLVASLKLRDMKGQTVFERQGIAEYQREMHHQPLRIVLPITWIVPASFSSGLYDLQLSVLNRVDEMVSQLNRRVLILAANPSDN